MSDELKHPGGTWKYTNRLAGQTSPYLLQHAHNPVDWYPWGPEAFEKAQREDKPIFLSVGYSTCYWCHVMERQSFENPGVAAVMNEHFVNIKVDREERPDVDDVYMTATQMMTGHGGWPMSVWLTPPGAAGPGDPGLKPYFAGTYFPPEPMHGRPGFVQVLQGLSKAWHERRDEVLEQADTVAGAVRDQLQHLGEPGQVGAASVQTAADQLMRLYDREHGGFGGAPKFPTPCYARFLLAVYRNNPDEALWAALDHTLDRMARGGMYDQVGGGFHRYSVDAQWLVPHFEKMLYDNGQLTALYAEAHQVRPSPQYARVMRETCDYILREMTDPTGAFWSAQDAEVNAMEGGNYVWTRQQVEQAIDDPDLRALAVRMYGLERGTNFQDPHHPDAPPVNVLYLPEPLPALGDNDAAAKRQAINQRLLAVRDQRDQPATDDKVLTSWNGLMIAGMAKAGRALGERKRIEAAGRAAEAVMQHMSRGDMLYRSMRAGEVKIPGFLEDYAFFVHGLLELHRAAEHGNWLEHARRYTDAAIGQFEAQAGGYFDTLADQADLFVRVRTVHDGAIPSGNSQMIHNLMDLHELTGEAAYLERAARDLRSFADALNRSGANMAHMQHALLRALEVAPEALVAGAGEPQVAEGPVSVSVSPQVIDLTSGEARVRVILQIAETYHINANQAAADLIPTTIELAGSDGLEIEAAFPEADQIKFPFADEPLAVYTGRVVVPVTLRRTGGSAPTDAALRVRYQACTDQACLAPRAVTVPLTIK